MESQETKIPKKNIPLPKLFGSFYKWTFLFFHKPKDSTILESIRTQSINYSKTTQPVCLQLGFLHSKAFVSTWSIIDTY